MIDFSKLTSEDLQALIQKNIATFFGDLAEGFQKATQKEETEKVDYSAFALDPRDLDLAY